MAGPLVLATQMALQAGILKSVPSPYGIYSRIFLMIDI